MTTVQQKRYFEFQDAKSAKFWEVTTDGTAVTVRYGKIGTNGQSQTKELADAAAAAKHVAKLVAEKTGKGYVESGDSAVAQATSEPVSEVAPTAPRKKAASPKEAVVTNPAKDPDASPESLLALLNKDDATNRLLARHPRASADLLEKLSHSSDKATRQAVAANPATPPEVYLRLGQQFPKEFLANPMLDLLLLERPSLLHDQPDTLLVQILRHGTCPEDFLLWAAGHESEKVQLAVAMNNKAPEQAKDKLRQSLYPKVRDSLPNIEAEITPEIAEAMFRDGIKKRLSELHVSEALDAWKRNYIGIPQWPYLSVTARLAVAVTDISKLLESGKIPDSIINVLLKQMPIDVKYELACNSNIHEMVFFKLMQDDDKYVKYRLAENINIPSKMMEELLSKNISGLSKKIADNPSTPRKIIENLITSGTIPRTDSENCPRDVLERLCRHPDKYIRLSVARNKIAPTHVLELLSEDSDEDVRKSVAENTSSPASALERLSKDKNYAIKYAVAKNISCPTSTLEWLAKDYRITNEVAENPSCPPELLQKLFKDSKNYFGSIARNISCPPSILESLHKRSKDDYILSLVAENINCPDIILFKLSNENNTLIKSGLASNYKTPTDVLIQIAKHRSSKIRKILTDNYSTPAEALHIIASDKSEAVRVKVATHPNTDNETINRLSTDASINVRISLLSNKNISEQTVNNITANLLMGDPFIDPFYTESKYNTSNKESSQSKSLLDFDCSRRIPRKLGASSISRIMFIGSLNLVDAERLAKISKSTDWLIRASIARHIETPTNILKKYLNDSNSVVSRLAHQNLNSPLNQLIIKYKNGTEIKDLRLNNERLLNEFIKRFKEKPYLCDPRDEVWARVCNLSVVWIDSDTLNDKVKCRLEKSEWEKIQEIISKNGSNFIYKDIPVEKQYSRFSKKNLNSTTSQLPIDDLDFYYDQINWRTIRDMLKRAEQPSEYIINGYIHLIRCALYVEDMTSRGIIPQFDPLNRESILNGLHLLEIVPKVMVFQDTKDSLKSQDWLERLGFALHPSSKPYHLKILSVDSDIDVSNAALWRLSNKL